MEALLKKQNELLTSLEKTAKRDELIQIAQLYEEKRIDNDGDRMEDQLKDLNTNVKKLNEKTGDNLNSNVIKLTDALREKFRGDSGKGLEATSELKTPRPAARAAKVDPDETARVVDEVSGRRRYNEFDNVKKDLKDLFSARGFLDKMGIARRGESGLISDFMDKRENRKNWVESRMRADPNMKNLKQYGGDEEKVKQYLTKRYDEKVSVEEKIFQNKEDIAEQRKRGMSDEQIKRMGLFKKQDELATQLKEIDPSLKQKPQTAKEQESKATEPKRQSEEKSAKVLPFTKQESAGTTANALGNEETMLEQNKMIAEQTGILQKIEENTAVLKTIGAVGGAAPVAAAAAEGGGPGILDMIPGKKILGGLKTAGKGLLKGAGTVGRFALRNAGRLGAVGAVGMGLYEGYQGWSAAGEKEEATVADINAKVESGEITPEQGEALKKEAGETATVEKGAAAGKGTGMALGGAAGALKGAAAGAALGSIVPGVGTVIGGAIGATVGAIGGTYLGGKAGEWIGEKAGKATNWVKGFFGGGKKEEGVTKVEKAASETSNVDIQFSEMTFAEKDRENYEKFRTYRDGLVEKYATENAKKYKRKEPNQLDYSVSRMLANKDAVLKFRTEIEAAGAGKVTGGKKEEPPKVPGEKTAEALQKTAEGVTGKPAEGATKDSWTEIAGERVVPGQNLSEKQMAVIGMAKSQGNSYSPEIEAQYAKQLAGSPTVSPPPPPNTGDVIAKQSSEVDAARMAAGKPSGGGNAIVNAPTVNNTTKTTQTIRSSPRTQENSVSRYLDKRYA